LAWSVKVTALPEVTVPLETLMAEVDVEIVPAVTVTFGSVELTAAVLIVAPIVVAVPAFTPVNDAV
jgi:hypothetical protein